jgi:hypothetical protein
VKMIAELRAEARYPRARAPVIDEIQETVIVSAGSVKRGAPRESTAGKEAGEKVPETVIISAREAGKQAKLDVESKGPGLQGAGKEKTKKSPEDEFLAETVMLTVEKKEK